MSQQSDFWSRRKAKVQAEAEAQAKARVAEDVAETQAALEEKSDDEILADLKLPDPDTLQSGDDFKAFLQQAVPERIRRRALRRLWTSNPVLANLDQLIDYGEDFTDASCVVENLQTTYQVGKGLLAHVREMEKVQSDETADEDEIIDATEAEIEVAETQLFDNYDVQELALTDVPVEADDVEPDALPRRRMRFEFET
ncbi:DUF3306 domain-containing protein [Pseudaestuariivita rosea]|uniref:DUF3306 domain-containing protein n=1 Tax=Pseudaestuariivita rosea TaxID=2763263 RepID=UPI001ABA4E5F|nr:DUF3306 domain-containing protein [Pseudaestuariivita rosea]